MKAVKIKKEKAIPGSVYFEPAVKEALEAHQKRARLNNFSAAVNDAVKYALFLEHRDDRNADVVKLCIQTLYSVNEHRMKTARDLTILHEMVALLAKNHFLHTRQIPSSDMAAAEAQAKVLMDAFMEQVARNVPKEKAEIAIDEVQKKAGPTA